MEQRPTVERPTYITSGTTSDRIEAEVGRYRADAYRERTYEEGKRAHADRLAETRLKSVAMAFDVYKQEPGTFGLSDVFALADRFVEYAREGNQPQDGTAGRFHGK